MALRGRRRWPHQAQGMDCRVVSAIERGLRFTEQHLPRSTRSGPLQKKTPRTRIGTVAHSKSLTYALRCPLPRSQRPYHGTGALWRLRLALRCRARALAVPHVAYDKGACCPKVLTVGLSSSSLAPIQPSHQVLVLLYQRSCQRRLRPSDSRLGGVCGIGSSDGACVRHRMGSSAGAAPADQPCSRRCCQPATARDEPWQPWSCWQVCRGDPVARCGRFEPFT